MPKTYPILDLNRRREIFRGVCNTPLHGYVQNLTGFIFPHTTYTKNAPGFIFPNRDTPKTRSILDPNPWRRTFRGVCNTPLHGYMKNPPGFRPKPSARIVSGRMQYAPTRIHEKTGGFHIFPSGYVKNAPDFTLSNRDTPKTHPVLGLNRRRETFRGVCFCALHGYMKNPAGFIPKPSAGDIFGAYAFAPYTGI